MEPPPDPSLQGLQFHTSPTLSKVGLWGRKLTLRTEGMGEFRESSPKPDTSESLSISWDEGFFPLSWGCPLPISWGLGHSGTWVLPTTPRQVLPPHLAGVGWVELRQRL